MIIRKLYIDIEIAYVGKHKSRDICREWNSWKFNYGGIIGILCLEIDTENETKKEIFFRQIVRPNMDRLFGFKDDNQFQSKYNGLVNVFSLLDNQLLETWNGRRFDLPIIINNLTCNVRDKNNCLNNLLTYDRDLIDICLKRGISIKGGLGDVTNRLNIGYKSQLSDISNEQFQSAYNLLYFTDFIFEDKTIVKGTKEYVNILVNDVMESKIYKDALEISRKKNEDDIRVLPLLEEKLGILYKGRNEEDNFRYKWR